MTAIRMAFTEDDLQKDEYENIISWSPNGDSFLIHDPAKFSDTVLNKYFKHNNFASFVRQVLFYRSHIIDIS